MILPLVILGLSLLGWACYVADPWGERWYFALPWLACIPLLLWWGFA